MYHDIIHQLTTVYPQGEAKALARMLFEEKFGLSQTDLLLGKDSELSPNQRTECQNIVSRLLKNEPIQYILGQTTFCNLRLRVAPGVLIPRPETQELVHWIQSTTSSLTHDTQAPHPLSVLDIGTGSGCIALALAHSGFHVEAWDISEEALTIARDNATRLHLDVDFRRADILQQPPAARQYHIIVSNPPYICQREAADMQRNVLDHEPTLALFVPDDDPLLFYRTIARFARKALHPHGHLFFEINRAYAAQTRQMLQQEGFSDIQIRKDAFGNDRMTKATLIPLTNEPHEHPE